MIEFEFKGTPGPWAVHPLAPCAVHQPEYECWIPQDKHDAQLIAAGPKMFKALLFGLENLEYGSDIEEFKSVARAALKDATGVQDND